MLELDVIEKSNSGWSSPVIMVPKKDGTYRFCIDFMRLNLVTKKDAYPLPYTSNILDNLCGAKYLSSLDIKSAYWHVMLDEDSDKYTAFTVPSRGLFIFTRLPFGLHNAPATFQKLVETIFGADKQPYTFVYFDNIIIATPTFELHLQVLETVLKRLSEDGLTLSLEKYKFCGPQTKVPRLRRE